MKFAIDRITQTLKLFSIAGFLIIIAGCQTPHWRQGYDLGDEVKKLTVAGKCDEAIKSYDKIKNEYLDVRDLHNIVASLATSSYAGLGKKPFSQCLIENGRAEEVIRQFELACLPNQKTYITAQYQTFICTEIDFKYVAGPAYKIAGRENPFEKNPGQLDLIRKNSEYISQIDTAISNIYKRIVTQSTGTPAETRRYYNQMRAATIESIALLDRQIPKCQAEKNSLCLKFLTEKRQEETSDLANWNSRIKESQEDHEAAQRIAQAAPAILGAIAKVGSGGGVNGYGNLPAGVAPGNASHCLRFHDRSATKITLSNSCSFTIQVYRCGQGASPGNIPCMARPSIIGLLANEHDKFHNYEKPSQASPVSYGACKGTRDLDSNFYIRDGVPPTCN